MPAKKLFFCQNCGYESVKWLGQCPGCKEWNSFVEEPTTKKISAVGSSSYIEAKPSILKNISAGFNKRISTGINEFDRVLGGGIVSGSLILIGGEPGIGKSTLLMQACINLSKDIRLLYVSGEESEEQIKGRADRINQTNDNFLLFCNNSLENIIDVITKSSPKVVVIDSIQTVVSENISSASGSVSQVRENTASILRIAKENDITFFIIGHVTKDGMVAGPKVLEHMVDTVLYFEGENTYFYRVLRSIKNRFGSTNEIGIFEMSVKGLVEVINPSKYMLNELSSNNSGSVITCTVEGTRAILLELQALVADSIFQLPRRTSYGIDYNRVNLLMAVLEKKLNLKLMNCDIYINVAGGLKITEPSADLAVVMSTISSYKNLVIPQSTVVFGEVGLGGEVRGVTRAENRVYEAIKLGFKIVIMPYLNYTETKNIKEIKIIYIKHISEILSLINRGTIDL